MWRDVIVMADVEVDRRGRALPNRPTFECESESFQPRGKSGRVALRRASGRLLAV